MKPGTLLSDTTRDSVRPLKGRYGRTKLKLLYTLVLIICMSAFASSKNECTYPARDSNSCGKGSSPVKAVKEFSKEISEERPEFSTFQFVKFLYI